MMNFVKKLFLVVAILLGSFLLAIPVATIIETFFGVGDSFGDYRLFIGFPLVYIFLILALFIPFGGRNWLRWVIVLLIPIVAYELYFQLEFILDPLVAGVLGGFVGWGILKLKPFVLKK